MRPLGFVRCGFAAAITTASLLASCSVEPALYLPAEQESGPVRIATDWSAFLKKETPSGMTIVLFKEGEEGKQDEADNLSRFSVETTNDITGANFSLQPAKYAAYVFNQSTSEFGTINFSNLDNWKHAEAKVDEMSSKWYTKDKVRAIADDLGFSSTSITEEPLVTNVEWLGAAKNQDILLTQEMLDSAQGKCFVVDTLYPCNVVYTVTVYVHIKNIGGLRSARASIQGLADGYMFGEHHTTENKATQLLERWSLTIDSTSTDGKTQYGTIVAQIPTLGLPHGHGGKPLENILHLECLMKNDSILTFNYQVGDKFEWDPEDNVDLHFTIDITMEDPLPDVPTTDDENSSAFEVTVEDWGDEQGVPISM